MGINLADHKIYVENVKMEMVPYSIAMKALEEVTNPTTEKYFLDFEKAMEELRNSINDIKLDD